MNGIEDGRIDELVGFVMAKRGTDMSRYRSSCIRRRIGHRLVMLGLASVGEYLEFLQRHPGEIDRLLDVLTIHVTGFFRDGDVFEKLANSILPGAIERRLASGGGSIRVWSAGCSTGEETWSLVIALDRLIQATGADIRAEVFGTDVSEDACRTARRGVYGDDRVDGIPPVVLDRYFEKTAEGWRIARETRSDVRFRVHNLFSAPPFSMLDVVVCRNVLIHFEHSSRSDVLRNFHRALREDGVLVLGKSEAVTGPALELFELTDPRAKTYRKRTLCPSFKEE